MNADPIPLAMLNALVYCPRRYYLEHVEGVFAVNAPVMDGKLKHSRVDDPKRAMRTRKSGDEFQTRSVQLGSESLGLIGVLDVVEETDGVPRPVEFKRGEKPKDNDGRDFYWENDAVQLCAQALLLEENLGKAIPEGVLYYIGSRDRVNVPLTQELRETTRNYVKRARELDRAPQPPEPLIDSPKCPKCSLLAICMPQETRFLRERQTREAAGPPKLVLAPVDAPSVLYFQDQGAWVEKRGEHLEYKPRDSPPQRIPLVNVSQVVIFGHVQFTTGAQEVLLELGIPVVFLSIYGQFIGTLAGPPSKNGHLRLAQYQHCSNPEWSLATAREVVMGKILNQRTLLMRSLRSSAPDESEEPPRDADAEPQEDFPLDFTSNQDTVTFGEMKRFVDRARDAQTSEELLGWEGSAGALYFGNFARMLRDTDEKKTFDFQTRNRRPPRDPVNALLSFAYAMLVKDVTAALLTVGLDPYIGFFHAMKHGRPSLTLDLMEEFRPVIADSVVITLINKQMLTPRDFVNYGGTCLLTESGRKTFFQAWEQRRKTEVLHPLFKYRCSYQRTLEVQARQLAGVFRGEFDHYQPFLIR